MNRQTARRWLKNRLYPYRNRRTRLFQHILIQTNSTCTQKCHFCLYGMPGVKVKNTDMSEDLFRKIVGELAALDYDGRVSLFEINEPLSDPRVIEWTRYVKENVPRSWQLMITNGDLLTVDKATKLIRGGLDYLSISSYSPKGYVKSRRLRHRLPEDVRCRTVHRVFFDRNIDFDNRGGNLEHIDPLTEPLKEPCERVNHVLYIKPDGRVVSCFGDFFNVNVMGDANEQTVEEIWFGETFENLRHALNRSDRTISELCKGCNITGKIFAQKWYYERDTRKPETLNGAIVGGSSSARMFHPVLEKHTAIKYVVSHHGYDRGKAQTPYEEVRDLETVLADPFVDFVFIASENNRHYEQAKAALLAKKHVLVEKPMVLDLAHLEELKSIAERNQLQLAGVFQFRFLPVVRHVKRLIREGAFGRLAQVNGRVPWRRGDDYYVRDRGTWEVDGGGALIKQGIHALDLVVHLAGRPVEWSGRLMRRNPKRRAEDTAELEFRFEEGTGTFTVTTAADEQRPAEIEVVGASGRVRFDFTGRVLEWECGAPWPEAGAGGHHEAMVLNFARSVLGEESLNVTADECAKSLALILDVYAGAERHFAAPPGEDGP